MEDNKQKNIDGYIKKKIEILKNEEKKDIKIVLIIIDIIILLGTIITGITKGGINILIMLLFIIVLDILLVSFIKMIYKNKYNVLENSKNNKLEKLNIIKDVEEYNYVYKYDYNKFLEQLNKRKHLKKVTNIITIVIFILFACLTIINLNNYMVTIYMLLTILLPVVMYFIILIINLNINDYINDSLFVIAVKTKDKLIVINAKPLEDYDPKKQLEAIHRKAYTNINYLIGTSLAPSPIDGLLSLDFLNKSTNLFKNDIYDEQVIENLLNADNPDKLHNILASSQGEYKIVTYYNPHIIKNTKDYFIIRGTVKKETGSEVLEDKKIYKVLNEDIEL